jgi:hypothetical protein
MHTKKVPISTSFFKRMAEIFDQIADLMAARFGKKYRQYFMTCLQLNGIGLNSTTKTSSQAYRWRIRLAQGYLL